MTVIQPEISRVLRLYVFVLGALLLGGVLLPGPAGAGTQNNARLALHATNQLPNACTNSAILTTPCSSYVTARSTLTGGYVYLVVTQADPVAGIKALSCGIDYTGSIGVGIDPRYVNWTYCGDGLDFPSDGGNGDWPAPAGGMRLTWLSCQTTEIAPDQVHAVAGFFYVYAYSPDKFEITRNENLSVGPELQVADCAASPTNLPLSHAGFVEFGGGPGYNPCTATPPPPPSNSDSKLALHATRTPEGTGVCTNPEVLTRPCSGYRTSRPDSTSYVYLVVAQADPVAGIKSVSCGIDYTGSPGVGIDPGLVFWHGCHDGLEIPTDGGNGDWPAQLGGLQVVWNTCQTTEISPDNVHAVVGAFYVYAYGKALFKVTRNNNVGGGPELKVGDCSSGTYELPISHAGFVEFGVERGGYNPCAEPPPVVGIEDQLPARFALLPAAPNPSYATTNVRFDLPEPAEVTLQVFALDGSLVRELAHDALYPAGQHEVQWDGRNDRGQRTGAGVYLMRLKTGERRESVQKIVRIGR